MPPQSRTLTAETGKGVAVVSNEVKHLVELMLETIERIVESATWYC